MSLLLAQLSAVQNYTLTVSVGTYTLTGIAVTFAIVMPVSARVYVLTGVAVFFCNRDAGGGRFLRAHGGCRGHQLAAFAGRFCRVRCPDRGGRFFRHRHARREGGLHP
jgi:hypothetical protein